MRGLVSALLCVGAILGVKIAFGGDNLRGKQGGKQKR